MAGGVDTDAEPTGSAEPSGAGTVEELPILAVDDRPENLLALEAVLEPLGMPIVAASSGEEALRLLLERDVALILLDVRMPGMDGLETARLIKSRARTHEIPIVFLTASRDELGDIVRGYGLGAVDYVVKPFDAEVLRSKVAVFAQLERSQRRLKRSEALLRAAFDAAPVGKTVLDAEMRIVQANPAFARIVESSPNELVGRPISSLCLPEDRNVLAAVLERASARSWMSPPTEAPVGRDLRLLSGGTTPIWVAPAASPIEPAELGTELLLVQWVDVTGRRREEQARAELLIEQAARELAEGHAERLEKLHRLLEPVDAPGLDELVGELARRLTHAFDADAAEVEVERQTDAGSPTRSIGAHVQRLAATDALDDAAWEETPLVAEKTTIGTLRVLPHGRGRLGPAERNLLRDAADRISLMIRRTQLHEQERRIAVELQHGLLPPRPPELEGVAIAAQLEAAGLGAEVGGDWYDSFILPDGRLGVVIGDVTGSGIRAASTMGQIRSVTRAFALADSDPASPAEVLTRVQRFHRMTDLEELLTAIYLILDPSSGRLAWANAGHPPPLLRTSDGEVQRLSGVDSMMCRIDSPYHDREVMLSEGDTLVLYTDGLIERRGESIDAGINRLAEILGSGSGDAEELCAQLLEAGQVASSSSPDDVTALVVQLTASGSGHAGPGDQPPGQRVHVTLAPEVSVPAAARRLLERSFGDALDRTELERAKVAISELATNAVAHGQGEVTVVAELVPERLLVEVIDQGSGFEHVIRQRDFDEVGGWGLQVVDAETSRWGIHEGTTHVWFEIERSGPRLGSEKRPG